MSRIILSEAPGARMRPTDANPAEPMHDEYPGDADGVSLRTVAEGGSDMSRPMIIDFSIAVADEASARRIAALVEPLGFDPSIYNDPDRGSWSVYASKSMLATYAGVVAARRQLNELVGPLGGNCDGWASFGNSTA
jgi:hypothetical protein